MHLLLHLVFELPIEHDLLLGAHLRVEKFNGAVPFLQLESPDVLKFGPKESKALLDCARDLRFDMLANLSDFEILWNELT